MSGFREGSERFPEPSVAFVEVKRADGERVAVSEPGWSALRRESLDWAEHPRCVRLSFGRKPVGLRVIPARDVLSWLNGELA